MALFADYPFALPITPHATVDALAEEAARDEPRSDRVRALQKQLLRLVAPGQRMLIVGPPTYGKPARWVGVEVNRIDGEWVSLIPAVCSTDLPAYFPDERLERSLSFASIIDGEVS